MAIAAFSRMTAGILVILGEDALLRGSIPCRVNIEHGVQVSGPDGMTVLERSVATIAEFVEPKVGDALMHPQGSYRLDVETGSNGYSKRFILLPMEA